MSLVPPDLGATRGQHPTRGPWLDALPQLVSDLLGEWSLSADGETTSGHTALVLPVRTTSGRLAALKVGWPHEEAEHEHLVLRRWNGHGAVELFRADPRRSALLLERLHREDLSQEWDVAACEMVGGLYERLHVPAMPALRPISAHVERWVEELGALPVHARLPHRMVQQAISIGRGLLGDPDLDACVVHTDLHYGNVLAADREPWLAIDPKPLNGDPHCEVAPLLWNRFEELAGDVRRGVRARFHAVVDAAGLDHDRARDWVVLRLVVLATDRLRDPAGAVRQADMETHLTRCVAVAKAVQD